MCDESEAFVKYAGGCSAVQKLRKRMNINITVKPSATLTNEDVHTVVLEKVVVNAYGIDKASTSISDGLGTYLDFPYTSCPRDGLRASPGTYTCANSTLSVSPRFVRDLSALDTTNNIAYEDDNVTVSVQSVPTVLLTMPIVAPDSPLAVPNEQILPPTRFTALPGKL